MVLYYLQNNENVFVTGGSEKSINYLINNLGIKKENIINYKQFGNGKDVNGMVNLLNKLNNNNGINITFDNVGGNMKLLCCKSLGIDGHMSTIVEEPDIKNKNPQLYDIASNIFTPSNSILIGKNASLHCEFILSASWFGNEQNIKKYNIQLTEMGNLFREGINNINHNKNKKYFVNFPNITEINGGITVDNVANAMKLLGKGVQGKIVVTV